MIHRGGHGSTLTALAAGTPALIFPTYSERESNARRVVALDAGSVLFPKEPDSPDYNSTASEWVTPSIPC